jgi:predicted membrane GTPase involved in stress response
MKATEKRISDLTDTQKSHLAWRLDHKTYVGYLTACRIARGEFGNDTVVDVFRKAGRSDHSAKIHARKVVNFHLG